MQFIRNRARLFAAIALMWHVGAIAAVSTALSCDSGAASEHTGMAECPLHQSVPACPLHAEKHGTHDCDCPTIGCAQTDAGFLAFFGAVGILPAEADITVPPAAGDAALTGAAATIRLASVPLSPPPRV